MCKDQYHINSKDNGHRLGWKIAVTRMHITYRKIVGEQMSPVPPLLSRLVYSAHLQNREVYYLLFDYIALQIPDAPYSGMLASLRLGLDCATPIRVSLGSP
jgi:hypothetical protein